VDFLPEVRMTVAAKTVRYIKLGRGGRWEGVSLQQGELHFGYRSVPHELALGGNREQIKEHQIGQGRDPRAAAEDAREVTEFYQLGADCLWVTFAQGHLWWTFAETEVIWLGDGDQQGVRIRKSIGGWRNTDINGDPLRMDSLSTKLTKVASYRRTICTIDAQDYLLRRINGVIEPLVAESNLARDALVRVLTAAIQTLHWSDFETLVDMMFARSGWYRASPLGETQTLVDLVLEQPSSEERAAAQVKSAAGQKQLEEFINGADETGLFDHLFFACHSPKGSLAAPDDRSDIHVWVDEELARTALRLGLADWVIEKIS
jgi:hypothetical protein